MKPVTDIVNVQAAVLQKCFCLLQPLVTDIFLEAQTCLGTELPAEICFGISEALRQFPEIQLLLQMHIDIVTAVQDWL